MTRSRLTCFRRARRPRYYRAIATAPSPPRHRHRAIATAPLPPRHCHRALAPAPSQPRHRNRAIATAPGTGSAWRGWFQARQGGAQRRLLSAERVGQRKEGNGRGGGVSFTAHGHEGGVHPRGGHRVRHRMSHRRGVWGHGEESGAGPRDGLRRICEAARRLEKAPQVAHRTWRRDARHRLPVWCGGVRASHGR